MRFLVCLVILLLSSTLSANPTSCEEALKNLAKFKNIEIKATNWVNPSVDKLSISPVAGTLTATSLEQITRQHLQDGSYIDSQDYFVCEGGFIKVKKFIVDTAKGNAEIFDPPFPWMPLEFKPGMKWNWEGTIQVGNPGSKETPLETHNVSFSFSTGEKARVKTPQGEMETIPLFHYIGGDRLLRTTWFSTKMLGLIVKRERKHMSKDGKEIMGKLLYQSMEKPSQKSSKPSP